MVNPKKIQYGPRKHITVHLEDQLGRQVEETYGVEEQKCEEDHLSGTYTLPTAFLHPSVPDSKTAIYSRISTLHALHGRDTQA